MDKKQREGYVNRLKKGIFAECLLVLALAALVVGRESRSEDREAAGNMVLSIENDYIKWVDFTISYEALCKAYDWDVKTHGTEHEICWVDLLAYTAARTGGNFDNSALKIMDKAAKKLSEGEKTLEELTADLKYYEYYQQAYDAAIGGLVGEYKRERTGDSSKAGANGEQGSAGAEEAGKDGGAAGAEEAGKDRGAASNRETGESADSGEYETVYGLKGYFPIARGFDYTHYDDFGAGRSYGYKRKHLGHDMMGLVGTPIIAVESGVVEALGWNQYGGWRIGIRSFDGKRYYYYAHLRQNYPYAEGLAEGSVVTAGDVIGYMGHTGYSAKENVNNIDVVHLHWGLQLIFDESQKEGNNEIWIDLYALTRFLAKHTQAAVKVEGTKEWRRKTDIVDPAVEEYEAGNRDGAHKGKNNDADDNGNR